MLPPLLSTGFTSPSGGAGARTKGGTEGEHSVGRWWERGSFRRVPPVHSLCLLIIFLSQSPVCGNHSFFLMEYCFVYLRFHYYSVFYSISLYP